MKHTNIDIVTEPTHLGGREFEVKFTSDQTPENYEGKIIVELEELNEHQIISELEKPTHYVPSLVKDLAIEQLTDGADVSFTPLSEPPKYYRDNKTYECLDIYLRAEGLDLYSITKMPGRMMYENHSIIILENYENKVEITKAEFDAVKNELISQLKNL